MANTRDVSYKYVWQTRAASTETIRVSKSESADFEGHLYSLFYSLFRRAEDPVPYCVIP